MKVARILIIGAAALSGWAAVARPAPAPAAPKPADIVAARQAAMNMGATSLNALKTASAAGTPVKNLAFGARGLAKWGAALPAMFAPSTRAVASRAKPEVWTDGAGFAGKAGEFGQATEALFAAAQGDDKDAFAAALARTGAACKGCHDSFQTPPPAAKPG
jgi:cytochrome c556